ncbi:MAG TPA: hypothetical protein PKX56_08785, partial [Marmoricola sp.]|nr:hypothetical protein [Marmoricola sp.]
DPELLTALGEVLAGIRGAKSTAKVTQRTPVEQIRVSASATVLEAINSATDDLNAAGQITGEWELVEQDGPMEMTTVLGEPPQKKPKA